MSKKASPTLIGGFVVGAVSLLAAGVALFGGAELFADRQFYVAYFEEQTNGLRVGSNVSMNGVRVGQVADVDLLLDEVTFEPLTRVTIEIFPDTLIITSDGVPVAEAMREEVEHDELINVRGLRAQLGLESFVTGQLRIEMEFQPEKPPRFHGTKSDIPEIPTIPSSVSELLAKVRRFFDQLESDVDIEQLSARINSILEGFDELVNSEDLRASLRGIEQIINDDDTQEIGHTLRVALDNISVAATDASELFNSAGGDLDSLANDLRPALQRLNSALDEAEQTLAAAKVQLRGDTEQMYQLQSTLTQVEQASRAIREFFDYLERNPEALLKGK